MPRPAAQRLLSAYSLRSSHRLPFPASPPAKVPPRPLPLALSQLPSPPPPLQLQPPPLHPPRTSSRLGDSKRRDERRCRGRPRSYWTNNEPRMATARPRQAAKRTGSFRPPPKGGRAAVSPAPRAGAARAPDSTSMRVDESRVAAAGRLSPPTCTTYVPLAVQWGGPVAVVDELEEIQAELLLTEDVLRDEVSEMPRRGATQAGGGERRRA